MSSSGRESIELTERTREASEWLIRLQAEDIAEVEVGAWLKWCAADEANLEAFERMQRLYDQLQSLPANQKIDFLQLQRAAPDRGGLPNRWRQLFTWSTGHTWALGGGAIVAAVLIVFFGTLLFRQSRLNETAVYSAPHGTQQTLLLADHSRVTLASASEFSTHYTPGNRYIDLREGEAYFEVQPDHSRPFVVRAGGMTVTAVGTKFNVRRTRLRTVVSVTEGAVDVTTDSAGEVPGNAPGVAQTAGLGTSTPVRVRAGQQAVRAPETPGLVVTDVSPDVAVGWRQGRLAFVMEPLSSVVADVNRYAAKPVVLEDPSLGALVFTGTVFSDRVDEWALALPSAFPVAASLRPDGTLLIQGRDNRKQKPLP